MVVQGPWTFLCVTRFFYHELVSMETKCSGITGTRVLFTNACFPRVQPLLQTVDARVSCGHAYLSHRQSLLPRIIMP